MDPKEEARLLKIFEELEQEELLAKEQGVPEEKLEDEESDEDCVENNLDFNTDSELSGDDSDDSVISTRWSEDGPNFIGKDGKTIWKVNRKPKTSRARRHNIITHLPGVKPEAKTARTPFETWNLLITDQIIEEIVRCTNIYLSGIRKSFSRPRDVMDTDAEEIQAIFGILYMAGTLKSRHTNLNDLWATDATAPEFFRLVMSKNRFYLLLRSLRFDDISTRAERRKIDKLAPIRNIFEKFQERCQACYTPGENCTIDEMLEGFRGRCSFRQYIPSKPNKYGIKIFALADSRSFYTLKMEIYAGKQPEGPFMIDNSPASVVNRLCEPIANSGRNLTCDNWFTSVPLALDLLKNKRLTLVGTIRKNKREIPPIFVATKGRKKCSSMFAFGRDCLLVSYVPKVNKNVLVLSTLHENDTIDPESGDAFKPEAITDYNRNKSGVDTVDQLKSLYSVSRITCRWPMTVFFSVLNIAGINSFVIFRSNSPDAKDSRRLYLKFLAEQLVKPHMMRRVKQTLPYLLSLQIKQYLNLPLTEKPDIAEPEVCGTRPKCFYCPKKKNRKTSSTCSKCLRAICKEHSITYCAECVKSDSD